MTITSVLCMLLGAALVAGGVLASALADRIRGLRVARNEAPSRERTRREKTPAQIQVVDPTELLAKQERPRTPRSEVKMQSAAQDVIQALHEAGYKKTIAEEAVWGCGAADRATVETWTAAALRRCVRGGLS